MIERLRNRILNALDALAEALAPPEARPQPVPIRVDSREEYDCRARPYDYD